MKKRLVVLVMVLGLCLTLLPVSAFAAITPKSGFSDVPDSSPFSEAVAWAVSKGITKGTTDTTFSPSNTCTHNHILTFLWRSQGSPDAEGSTDFERAINWAIDEGLAFYIDGEMSCTRAGAVGYLWKLAGSPDLIYSGRFADVPLDAGWGSAIEWAVNKGITTGTDASHFSPYTTCTRGQIVTFLYRAYA